MIMHEPAGRSPVAGGTGPGLSAADPLAAPPARFSDRHLWVGASDASIIMGSNDSRILRLWREKRGEAEREDLSDRLPVQLGLYLEPFILDWHARHCGVEVTRRGEVVRDRRPVIDLPMQATLDGWDGQRPVEAKATGWRVTPDDAWARYLPQLAHQAIVTGAPGAVLSVLRGNEDWYILEYQRSAEYEAALLEAEAAFWRCVQSGEPPRPLPPPPMPKPRGVVEYDMAGSNAWAIAAALYHDTREAARQHAAAKDEIKALVPEDASRAFGHGVEVRRDKRGALRFYEGGEG